MSTTYYRVDSPERPDSDLLAAASHRWSDGSMEDAGLSVMGSVDELIDYLTDPVNYMAELLHQPELQLVAIEGDEVGIDSDGCPLVAPVRITRRGRPFDRADLFDARDIDF